MILVVASVSLIYPDIEDFLDSDMSMGFSNFNNLGISIYEIFKTKWIKKLETPIKIEEIGDFVDLDIIVIYKLSGIMKEQKEQITLRQILSKFKTNNDKLIFINENRNFVIEYFISKKRNDNMKFASKAAVDFHRENQSYSEKNQIENLFENKIEKLSQDIIQLQNKLNEKNQENNLLKNELKEKNKLNDQLKERNELNDQLKERNELNDELNDELKENNKKNDELTKYKKNVYIFSFFSIITVFIFMGLFIIEKIKLKKLKKLK